MANQFLDFLKRNDSRDISINGINWKIYSQNINQINPDNIKIVRTESVYI